MPVPDVPFAAPRRASSPTPQAAPTGRIVPVGSDAKDKVTVRIPHS